MNKKLLIRTVISVLFISLLLSQTDTDQLLSTLRIVNIQMLLFALFIFILSTIMNSFRWYLLVKAGNLEFSFSKILSLNFTGFFFSIFLPGRTGGDIARAYYIAKSSECRARAVSTIIVWRLLGVISLTLISVISAFFIFPLIDNKSIIWNIIIAVFSIYFLLFILSRKNILARCDPIFSFLDKVIPSFDFRSKIVALYSALGEYISLKKLLFINLIIGITVHSIEILSWYLISLSIGIDSSFIVFMMIVPIINLLQIIPLTFSGVGLREGAAIVLFGYIGFTDFTSLSIGFLSSLFNIILGLIGGIVYLLRK